MSMTKNVLIIYEGAMCCSTGVCGPEPDKELIDFNESLKKLRMEFKDIEIIRASISFNINMFLESMEISQLVKENGPDILPIITLNGKIASKQKYLNYDELKTILNGREK